MEDINESSQNQSYTSNSFANKISYFFLTWLPNNIDDLASYSTFKVLYIRDRRPGILYYLFLLSIIIYVIGYAVLYKKEFFKVEQPYGGVRLDFQKPLPAFTNSSYCSSNENFTCEPISHADYNMCIQSQTPLSSTTENITAPTLPCYYWDAYDAVKPYTEQTAILLPTMLFMEKQQLLCNLSDIDCSYTTYETDGPYFTPDVERWTLLIDHSMVALNSKISRTGRELLGSIVNQNNQVLNFTTPTTQIGEQNQFDIISLEQILQAGGINSLDQVFQGNCNTTIRYSGIVIIVSLTYNNVRLNDDRITYLYRISPITTSSFTSIQTIEPLLSNNDTVERLMVTRNGVRLIFIQSGTIGVFNFQNLLLSLVSGLGLLIIAQELVDQLALRILPQRRIYRKFKYENTPFFEQIRKSMSIKGDE